MAAVVLPALATVLTRRAAAEVAPLRGALATDAIDLTHAPTWPPSARPRTHWRLLAALGFAVDAAGVLVAGLTAGAVVYVALGAGVDGVLVGVLAVGTLAAVEIALALVGAARQWTGLRSGLARVAHLLAPDDAGLGTARTSVDQDGLAERALRRGRARPALPRPPRRRDRTSGTPAGGYAVHTAPSVRFDGVTVRYRIGAAAALDGFDLELPPGRRVAVVGPSGAGKSTLAAVLTGAVSPTAGRVTLDGRDVSAHPSQELPRLVGGLLAEAYVFHATVRDNMLLGRPGADEDALLTAATAAGLSDWVRASRTAGTPWSARRADSSPVVNVSGSRWLAPCWPRPAYWCSTNPRRASTRSPPTRCWPARWPRLPPGTRYC